MTAQIFSDPLAKVQRLISHLQTRRTAEFLSELVRATTLLITQIELVKPYYLPLV